MSSLYVVKTLSDFFLLYSDPDTVFHNSINEDPKPKTPYWFTAEFITDFVQQEAFCKRMREDGEIILTVCGRSGEGFEKTMQKAEQIADYVHSYKNTHASNPLFIGPHHEINQRAGDDVRWFCIDITISYIYRYSS